MTESLLLEGEDRHAIIRLQTTVLFIMRKPEVTYKLACRLQAPEVDDRMTDG